MAWHVGHRLTSAIDSEGFLPGACPGDFLLLAARRTEGVLLAARPPSLAPVICLSAANAVVVELMAALGADLAFDAWAFDVTRRFAAGEPSSWTWSMAGSLRDRLLRRGPSSHTAASEMAMQHRPECHRGNVQPSTLSHGATTAE